MKKKKAKVYIDGANVFYTQKKLGWSFDWMKVKRLIEKQREIIEWRYYVGVKEGDEKMQSYLKYLNAIGFTLFTKKLKKIKIDKSDIPAKIYNSPFIYKANFDVEITADILSDKSKIDEIILFSGDSDFTYLVRKVKDSGKTATIYSSRKTIAWELKLESPRLVYIEGMEKDIKKR